MNGDWVLRAVIERSVCLGRAARISRLPSVLGTALVMAAVPLLPAAGVWLVVTGLMMGPSPGAIVALVPGMLTALAPSGAHDGLPPGA
jgi:hypothetical protein